MPTTKRRARPASLQELEPGPGQRIGAGEAAEDAAAPDGGSAAPDGASAAPDGASAATAAASAAPEGGLKLLPAPDPGCVALSLEAATLDADPDAPAGVTLGRGGAAGRIEAVGEGVTERFGLRPGQRAALPARAPCGACDACAAGQAAFCDAPLTLDLAQPLALSGPVPRGLVIAAERVVPLSGVAPAAALLLQPLAAALHAVEAAGPALGRRALVTGGGLEGALAVVALRLAGAAEVQALVPGRAETERMRRAGADGTIDAEDPAAAAEALEGEATGFDLCLDVSGAPAALEVAGAALRRGGTLALAGRGGAGAGPFGAVGMRELRVIGAARPLPPTGPAAALLSSGRAAEIGALVETAEARDLPAAAVRAEAEDLSGPLALLWG